MATIQSQMVLNDGVSAVLKKITAALNTTLHSFEQVQRASGAAIDTESIQAAQVGLEEAAMAAGEMAEGYRRAAQEEERLNQGVQKGNQAMDRMLGKVKKVAAVLAGVAGAKRLIALSDQMSSTTARLNLIVEDGGSVAALEAKVMASAQRSRAAYLDTAGAIASMGANAGAAFSGNDELIAFMEQVNKQFVIGGASAQGQSAAMLQLTQAMAAGALRGEELNSILENAPGIARAIERYMGAAEGSIKKYAEEGAVTAQVVKNALFAAAEETNAKFEGMPRTWGQLWTGMQNQALTALAPVLAKLNAIANSERFSKVVEGALGAFAALATLGAGVLDVLTKVGAGVVDSWSILAPVVWGVTAALVAYGGYLVVTSALEAASCIQKGLAAVAAYAHAAATGAEVSATAAATAAQYGFNAALLACPVTWVVLAVIALIAVFYAAVGAINHFTGSSLSATGFIAGAFAVLGAGILNTFVVPLWNALASVANFLGNVFSKPEAAVRMLFYNMALAVVGDIANMTHAIEALINKIPGVAVDITSGLDSFYNGLEQARQAVKDESGWVEYVAKMDRIDYSDAASAGYAFGRGVEEKIGGLFRYDGPGMDAVGSDISSIADSTGTMAKSLEISGEELEYLRDIAERDAVNRFTTAEVQIDLTGMTNKIEGTTDIDGVIRELTDGFTEALLTAAEGVHE